MKNLFPVGLFFAAAHAAAHPGHGRPGLLHFHEFSDGLVLVAFGVVIALICWAWRK
jgi:hypothetical protein